MNNGPRHSLPGRARKHRWYGIRGSDEMLRPIRLQSEAQ